MINLIIYNLIEILEIPLKCLKRKSKDQFFGNFTLFFVLSFSGVFHKLPRTKTTFLKNTSITCKYLSTFSEYNKENV